MNWKLNLDMLLKSCDVHFGLLHVDASLDSSFLYNICAYLNISFRGDEVSQALNGSHQEGTMLP